MELGNREIIADFVADASLLSCRISSDGRIVIVGDKSGGIHALRLIS
jgi:hypothetical protein